MGVGGVVVGVGNGVGTGGGGGPTVGVGVAVGSGVGVSVGRGTGVTVAVGSGVSVGVGVAVLVGAGTGVCVGVGTGVGDGGIGVGSTGRAVGVGSFDAWTTVGVGSGFDSGVGDTAVTTRAEVAVGAGVVAVAEGSAVLIAVVIAGAVWIGSVSGFSSLHETEVAIANIMTEANRIFAGDLSKMLRIFRL